MSKVFLIVTMSAGFAILDMAAHAANFQQRDKGPGTQATVICPPGTCSRVGTDRAYSLDRCSPANCRKKK